MARGIGRHSLTLTSFMYLVGSPLSDLSFSTSNLYYTLSSLLAFAILSLAYSRVRGLFGLDNENMSLTVKWGRERFVSSLLHLSPAPDMPRLYRPPSFPSPHPSRSPYHSPSFPAHCLLIRASAVSRSPFPHSIPNSPPSDRLFLSAHT